MAQCQLIEIIKAISVNAKVIVMDEPTAAITEREVELLFGHIRRLTEKGVAIIAISHRMAELFSICDRVSVYRDGKYIGTDDTENLDEAKLIKMMVGREIPELMGICDRIAVMCEGNYSGKVKREEFSQERIMALASAIKV